MYCTYILFSETKQRFYVGHTENIDYRISRHNLGMVKSTSYGIPWILKYKEEFTTRIEAVHRERQIKKRGAGRFLNDID
tara:strand:+ start:419 stop:655 length:237 start_codon:yes stop_codon:yes gene_type:complete